MKKLYQLAIALMAASALAFTGCSDSIEYEPAPAVEGEGVFFPEGTSQSIVLDATSGTFNMELYRSMKEPRACSTCLPRPALPKEPTRPHSP